MTDDTNFPKILVPTKSGSSVKDKFDTLARRLGDPMAKLFLLQNATVDHITESGAVVSRPDTEMQFRAAAELMPYRYPKLKVQEVNHNGVPPGAGQLSIVINLGPAPATEALPVPTVVDALPPSSSSPTQSPKQALQVSPVTPAVNPLD